MTAKVAETKTTTKTDEQETEFLELHKMMVMPKEQRNRFLPDDNPADQSGLGRRPVRFLMHSDQTMRDVMLVLPSGIKRHQDLYEHPLCFRRIMQDSDLKLRVTDKVTFMAHDFSWMHRAVVTSASDRVALKPDGTQIDLDWSRPQVAVVKAA